MIEEKKAIVCGAGLVGALTALALKREGWDVVVLERRSDPRLEAMTEGKSINLSMSTRGLEALKTFGVDEQARQLGIRMYARGVHMKDGTLSVQPYGTEPNDCNLSVSRKLLGDMLIQMAETAGAKFHFDTPVESVRPQEGRVVCRPGGMSSEPVEYSGALVVGADGAHSPTRGSLLRRPGFNYSQEYLDHSYKELTILPSANGQYRMRDDLLHIWARESFMLIALPNLDKTFTVTLFMPTEQFERLDHSADAEVDRFFRSHFADACELMPDYVQQYRGSPTGSLVTVHCDPHQVGRVVLLGDAAHAIVPFYGQGMNCGFEDVQSFVQLLHAHPALDELQNVLTRYSATRKPNTDAIATLSHRNYHEMRSHVNSSAYLLRKKLDKILHRVLGDRWIPLYSMVTYSTIPYAEVLERHHRQDKIVSCVLCVARSLIIAATVGTLYVFVGHRFNPWKIVRK